MLTKICNTCNINKDISLFWKNKAKPDWYDRECSEQGARILGEPLVGEPAP